MKKLKLLPSVLMLALCIGILGIGIYAANPTNKTNSFLNRNVSGWGIVGFREAFFVFPGCVPAMVLGL